jgi:hypothetical protein
MAKPQNPRLKRTQSPAEIGEIFGVAEKTVRRWAADGCPHRRDKSSRLLFNDGEVRAWLEANGKTAKPGRPADPKPDLSDLGGDKDYWLARKYRNQCMEDEKRLVDREQNDSFWMKRNVVAKSKLMGMGAAIAPHLVGLEVAEIQTRIEQFANDLCRELHAGSGD